MILKLHPAAPEINCVRPHFPPLVSPELGRPEHDEWRWVSCDEAAHLLPPRLQPVLAWARTQLAA
jgi:hypothetical protein